MTRSSAAELTELRNAELDLGGLGFSDDELRVLLADTEVPDADEAEEEEIPEAPAKPVTRAGDIWCIAGHRLICGDCRDPDLVQRLFDGAPRQSGDHLAAVRHPARIRSCQWLQARASGGVQRLVSATWPPISRRFWRRMAPTSSTSKPTPTKASGIST